MPSIPFEVSSTEKLPAGVTISAALTWIGEWARTAPKWNADTKSAEQVHGTGMERGAVFTTDFSRIETRGTREHRRTMEVCYQTTVTVLDVQADTTTSSGDKATSAKIKTSTKQLTEATGVLQSGATATKFEALSSVQRIRIREAADPVTLIEFVEKLHPVFDSNVEVHLQLTQYSEVDLAAARGKWLVLACFLSCGLCLPCAYHMAPAVTATDREKVTRQLKHGHCPHLSTSDPEPLFGSS
jgi:hypothetical protein